MLHLVYIGRYERTIEHFSKQVKESFYHVLTYAKATKIIDKIREKYYSNKLTYRKTSWTSNIYGRNIPEYTWYL